MTTTTYADSILSVYARATDSEREHGTDWYRDAQAIATHIAGGDTWKGAGVIAALSPRVRWDINIRNARRAFETGIATGHTKAMCAIAQRILDGEYAMDVLKGDKTRAFCAAIATGGDSDIATIDRHALETALGQVYSDKERPAIGKRLYREMAAAYAIAAESAGYLRKRNAGDYLGCVAAREGNSGVNVFIVIAILFLFVIAIGA